MHVCAWTTCVCVHMHARTMHEQKLLEAEGGIWSHNLELKKVVSHNVDESESSTSTVRAPNCWAISLATIFWMKKLTNFIYMKLVSLVWNYIYFYIHTHIWKSLNVFKHVFQIVKSCCLNGFFGRETWQATFSSNDQTYQRCDRHVIKWNQWSAMKLWI